MVKLVHFDFSVDAVNLTTVYHGYVTQVDPTQEQERSWIPLGTRYETSPDFKMMTVKNSRKMWKRVKK